ncbi:MAG: efflux RND transporter permease subunit, partial [Pseudomonadota bacterium]|nr:efflux RND transporter permease subunit [Pseudomonadota bacterium]
RRAEAAFALLQKGYGRSLNWALTHYRIMLVIFFATIACNVYLYKRVPKGFFPLQDTGTMIASIQADQAISFQAMSTKLKQVVGKVKMNPSVQNVVAFTGGGGTNRGFMFISLKPESQRPGVMRVIGQLRQDLSTVPGVEVFMFPVQDIRAGGRPSAAMYQYTLQSGSLADLATWTPRVLLAFKHIPGLNNVNSDEQSHGLEATVMIDRAAAARYGIPVSAIDATLNDAFGQRLVSTIYSPLNQYHVVMEAARRYLQNPRALQDIYMTAASGERVPLSALAHDVPGNTPLAVNHQGLFAAATISFNLNKGVSLEQAQRRIDVAMAKIGLPGSIQGGFQGTAKLFQQTLEHQPLFILSALLVIYIVLGMLYESTIHPVTILSTLPSAGVGA